MQQTVAPPRQTVAVTQLLAIFCLAFCAWFVAELSDGFFADGFFVFSLLLVLGLCACACHLWMRLYRETHLRERAENLMRGSDLRSTVAPAALLRAASPRLSPGDASRLTARELEVLSLIVGGRTNHEVAVALHISLNTVERHSSNIYRKLNVRGRVDATAYALVHGLVRHAVPGSATSQEFLT